MSFDITAPEDSAFVHGDDGWTSVPSIGVAWHRSAEAARQPIAGEHPVIIGGADGTAQLLVPFRPPSIRRLGVDQQAAGSPADECVGSERQEGPKLAGHPVEGHSPSVHQNLAEIDVERRRVEADLLLERRRAATAHAAASAEHEQTSMALGQMLLAMRRELSDMERQHVERLDAISAAADLEARSLLEDLRAEADQMRSAAAALAAVFSPAATAGQEQDELRR